MTGLLSAYLSRLWKEKLFWLAMLFMAGSGVLIALNSYQSSLSYLKRGIAASVSVPLEQYCFAFQWVIGVLAAVVSSLFLGREYQDGTLRSKLIAGHSRTVVYLAGLVVNILSALLLCLCYVLFACVTGIPLMGGFQADTGTILLLLLGNLLAVVAYCSLFTPIEMLSASRTGAIVTALLVTLVLLALGTLLVGRLQEPEWLSMASGADEAGSLIFGQAQPNPSYLGGPMRTVFQVLVNLLPTGQAFSLAGGGDEFLPQLPLYSVGLIAAATVLGILGFQKKDIA